MAKYVILISLIIGLSTSYSLATQLSTVCDQQLLQDQVKDPLSRKEAVESIKRRAQKNSLLLKQKIIENQNSSQVEYDLVIIGGGPATMAFVAGVKKQTPHLRILIIDESDTLSPAFEGPGEALIFNSQVFHDPHHPVNTHHFPESNIQLTDYKEFAEDHRVYPTGADIANLSWSQFASLNVDILFNTRANGLGLSKKSHTKVLTHEGFYVRTKVVVLATGQGQPNIDFLNREQRALVKEQIELIDDQPNQLGVETYLQALSYINNNSLMPTKYEAKRVAVVGGGDAALGLLETLLGLSVPSYEYGVNPNNQRPKKLAVYGGGFSPPNIKQFRKSTKFRYHHIKGTAGLFLPPNIPLPNNTADFRPLLGDEILFHPENVTGIEITDNKELLITDINGQQEKFDHVILATGFTNEASYFLNSHIRNLKRYSYENLPEELSPLLGDIVVKGGSYAPGSYEITNKDLVYSNSRLGFQFSNYPVYLIANAAGVQLIVSDDEALSGSQADHHKNLHKARSLTYSKSTLQHMLPRAFVAGIQIVNRHFSSEKEMVVKE